MSSPYQRISRSQWRTPFPTIPPVRPTPPTGIFQPSTPPSLQLPTEQITSVSLTPDEPIPIEEPPAPESFCSEYSWATAEEQQALVNAYLRDHPHEDTTMMELKAGLPRNFLGNEKDANLWLLQMKAYYALNMSLYNEKKKILAFLNKMDKGRGKSFSEGWLMKCADTNVKDEDRTFKKIKANFIEKFLSTNCASKARHALTHMKMEGDPFHSDFHKFKAEFELEAARSGITDKHILMDMLGRAVSANLAFKMMALLKEPTTHKLWLHKAGQFYNAAIQMKKLQGGTNYTPSYSGSKKSTRDPMAMDVDQIYLTPVQRAEHI